MAAGKHKRHTKAIAFRLRSDDDTGSLQRAKVRPEALYDVKLGLETVRQAKAWFGAEKENALARSRQGDSLGLEWVKKRLQRLSRHSDVPSNENGRDLPARPS
jgi:hypothetical protein